MLINEITQEQTDEFSGKLFFRLPPGIIRTLSILKPLITIQYIALNWFLIIGSIWLCISFPSPTAYLLTALLLGTRQHALGVLMHEGSHYRIFKNKKINDWVSDLFLAWPILITTASYRANHWQHHRHTNTSKDPDCNRKLFEMHREDWEFPTTRIKLAISFMKDLTAVSAFYLFKSLFLMAKRSAGSNKKDADSVPNWARAVFYLILLSLAVSFGFWKQMIVLWIVPYLTVFNLLLHIRAIAEHFATENDSPLNISRTTIVRWWERIFFPHNINYHIEHHLYPSVPFYHLPALHRVLIAHPAFKASAHVTQTYLGVLRECITVKGYKRTCLPGTH